MTDIPNVEKVSFSVKSELNNISCDFNLLYYVDPNSKNDDPVQINGYCANFIKVKTFNFNISLPKSPYIFLVKGQYFDDNANDSRTDFIIKSQERGITNFLNWKEIDETLRKNIQDVLNKSFRDIEEKNKINFESVVKKFPFFKEKFNKISSDSVGYLSQKDYMKDSYNQIDSIRNNLRTLQYKSLNNNLNEEEIGEILKGNSLDLAEYIVNRQTVIDETQKLLNKNTFNEAEIHNLILPKGKIVPDNNSLIDLDSCNLWLIDDKFMSFSQALSDRKIKQLKNEMGNNQTLEDSKEPDLMIYFDSPTQKRLVTIELKPFGDKKGNNKINGTSQITNYAYIINKNFPEIQEKWYYLITSMDEHFKRQLEIIDYKKLFSSGNMYFRYFENIQTYIYVLDMQTLINDANDRNKVFMDILVKYFDDEKIVENKAHV